MALSELITEGAALWWATFVPMAIQLTPILLGVGVLDRLLPSRTWPQLRSGLWGVALVFGIVPPSVSSPLSFGGWWAVDGWTRSLTAGLEEVAIDPTWAWLTNAAVGACFGWGLGVLFFGALPWWRTAQIRRRWTIGATAIDPAIERLTNELSVRLGLGLVPQVIVSPTVPTPCVMGWTRPMVFIPEDIAETVSQERLQHILLHELAHVARRDLWSAAVVTAFKALYWFHPLVWWAERRLSVLRELACDRTVARVLEDDVSGYRKTLLYFAARAAEDPRVVALRFVHPAALLSARLRQLEVLGPPQVWRRRLTTVALALGLVFGVLPVTEDARGAAAGVAELIVRPPGCLPLRHLVFKRLAEQAQEEE